MLGRLRNVLNRLQAKEIVGSDALGNKYYILRQGQGVAPRRMVDYAGDPAPEKIHTLWYMWLGSKINDPPTDAEVLAFDRKAADLQRRVREINAADRKLRLQELAERKIAQDDASNSDLSVQALISAMQGNAARKIVDEIGQSTARGGSGSGAAPGNAEPTGAGDEFKPGVWRPGGGNAP